MSVLSDQTILIPKNPQETQINFTSCFIEILGCSVTLTVIFYAIINRLKFRALCGLTVQISRP